MSDVSTTTRTHTASELVVYVAVAIPVLVAAAIDDLSDFGAQQAWFCASLLTIGYMISRGLAKSGSRDFQDDEVTATADPHRAASPTHP